MKQSWLKDVYDTIGKHTHNIEDGEYINRTLHAIAEVARETFAADICVLVGINPITNRIISPIVTAGELSLAKAVYTDNAVFYDTNVKAHIQQKGIWFTEEKEADPGYQSTFADREGICSTAAVVLQIEHSQSYGLLYLHFRQQHHFQIEERHDVQIFAEQAAALLLEIWLHFHYSQIENVEQEVLKQIDQEVNHTLDLDHVLITILEQAKALLQADEASILLYDKELQVLEARAALPGEAGQGQIIPLQDASSIDKFQQLSQLANPFRTQNPAIAKTFDVILYLRTLAYSLIPHNQDDDMTEYYTALLYQALNTSRFRTLPTGQREHALLSASLLADKLNLGG